LLLQISFCFGDEGGVEGLSLDKDNLTETFVGVTTTIATDEFATAIRQ
jgi:hypothetical protein